ncbi:hypothetical protein AB6N24_08645 [Cellulomonas sp. 179-A 4D5 NHS]
MSEQPGNVGMEPPPDTSWMASEEVREAPRDAVASKALREPNAGT